MSEPAFIRSKPKLRWPLDVQYLELEGQQVAVLRDRQGVAKDSAVIPLAVLAIVSQFDGETELADILRQGRAFGLTEVLLRSMVSDLDALCFLDNDKTRGELERIKSEFRQAPSRSCLLAGKVYPADPVQMRVVMEGYAALWKDNDFGLSSASRVTAAVSPHIDYERGGSAYGAVYSVLTRTTDPDVVFVFGTSHNFGGWYYHLTKKSFEFPGGRFDCETEVVQAIADCCGEERCFEDELLHRDEHSIELQLPFLRCSLTGGRTPDLVPILVGSFHEFIESGKPPRENQEIALFADAVAEQVKKLESKGKKVLLLAAVDLAHLGVHFGDAEKITPASLREVEAWDRKLLGHVLDCSADGLFSHLHEDGDRRRVCGFPALYTMLLVMDRCAMVSAGKLLDYRQSFDELSDCLVTYAAAAWVKHKS